MADGHDGQGGGDQRAGVPRMLLVRRDVYERVAEEARRRDTSPHALFNALLADAVERLPEGPGDG